MTCPQCGFDNPDGSRFCGRCGVRLGETCPSCGTMNPEGFAYCRNCGSALTALPQAPALEERKVVTILFADISGSTPVGERLDPEQVRGIMGRFFEAMAGVIGQFGGTVEKFIGDEVMAVFGLPAAHEDDPERAVRAAVAMQASVANLSRTLPLPGGMPLQVRIGINTGEVIANPHAADKGEFMVTGDAVNVAARLRGAAAPGTTMVGEPTHRHTAWLAEYAPHPPLALKGKSDPVPAWQLVGIREGADRRPRRAHRSPLVGRHEELALLTNVLHRVIVERRPHLVTVLGPPGVGKSRLVEELAAAGAAAVRRGRSLPYGSTSLWALGEIIRTDCGILRSDIAEAVRGKLQQRVREAIADEALRPQVETHLARILSVPLRDEPAGETPSRDALFWAVRRYLEAVAARAPLALVFEDIHWAESELLDLIEYLAQWAGGVPLLTLATARPELLEARPGWGGGKRNYTSLFLEPLSAAGTTALISELLDGAAVPPEVIAAAGVAEGNPLFIEEILHMLIDAQVLRRLDGEWALTAPAQMTIPPTVQGVVVARVDALGRQEKTVLLEASVLGKDFWSGGLAHLTGMAPPALDPILQTLQAKDFIVERERSRLEGHREFTFKHIVIQDAAYRMLPKARRVEQHRAFGAWLEQSLGDQAEAFVELLAHHWSRAAQLAREIGGDERWAEAAPKALRYLLAAAGKAARLYANEQAAAHYGAARALASALGADAERIAATEGLADVHALQAQWDEASRLYREALDFHLQRGDAVRQARVQSRIASTFSGVFDFRQALPHLESAAAKLQGQADVRDVAAVHIQLARTLAAQGGFQEAETHVREGVRLAEHHRLLPQLAEGHYVLGFIHTLLGRGEAVTHYERCVAIATEIGELVWAILGKQWNAYRHRWRGEYPQALRDYMDALSLARRTNNRPRLAFCLVGIAQTHFHAGDWPAAGAMWREYLSMADEVPAWADHARSSLAFLEGDLPTATAWAQKFLTHAEARREVTSIVLAIDWLAHLHLRLGRPAGAQEVLQDRVERLSRMGVLWPAFFHPVDAEALVALGDLARARDHLRRAGSYQWMGNHWVTARVKKAEAVLLAATQAWDAAISAALAGADAYRAVGNPYELALALEGLAGILLQHPERPDPDAARAALAEAAGIYRHLGAGFELRRLQESPKAE